MSTWLVDGETVVPAEQQGDGSFVVLTPQVGGGYAEGSATVPNSPGQSLAALASEHSAAMDDIEDAMATAEEEAYESALFKVEFAEVPALGEWSTGGEQAPLMKDASVQAVDPLTVSVTWATDPATAAGAVFVRVQGATDYTEHVEELVGDSTDHSVELTTLPATTYEVYAESPGDETGRTLLLEFTTDALAVPEITNIAWSDPRLQWDTDLESDSTVFYREAGTDTWIEVYEDESITTGHRIDLEGLAADTEHEFYVRSVTPYGAAAESDPDTFTTEA